MAKYILDNEEQALLNDFEKGKLKKATDADFHRQIAKKVASQHMKKEARINIRISKFDLERLKRIAAIEGIPYQTLISSVLHKYVHRTLDQKPYE
jgi:predicted DNA binding CopG/RHH family protein